MFPSIQWRIQDFPEVGTPSLQGGANILFCQIFPKTAWNWKNLDPQGASFALPYDLPMDNICPQWTIYCQVPSITDFFSKNSHFKTCNYLRPHPDGAHKSVKNTYIFVFNCLNYIFHHRFCLLRISTVHKEGSGQPGYGSKNSKIHQTPLKENRTLFWRTSHHT